MNIDCRSIYKLARDIAGLTQKDAAERIGVSIRTLAGYEALKPIPHSDIVNNMVNVYKANWLGYEHLRSTSELGKSCLPKIAFKSIAESVLMFQKEVNDLESINNDMINIACDNLIHDHEKDRWTSITKEIEEVAGAALSLIFTKEKTSLDGHLEKVTY